MARIMNAHSSNTDLHSLLDSMQKLVGSKATRLVILQESRNSLGRTQTEAFFDVAGWEKTLEKHNGRIPGTSKETRATAIDQGKKLSKTQLNLFKQQKMERKQEINALGSHSLSPLFSISPLSLFI
ncbi:hypothetical protein H4Q26_005971 [Puccinia striiformis f. sp. tritici PST-130]|nr:hypothetical protein H4Q26_005971 [Puccinia striiformis f. sp. tritici PST-130]